MNKIAASTLAVLFFCTGLVFASGEKESNSPRSSVIYEKVNYNDSNRRQKEIDAINELIKTDSILALWQAELLFRFDETNPIATDLVQKAKDAVKSQFYSATEKKDWILALRCYNSLDSLGLCEEIYDSWNVKIIENQIINNVQYAEIKGASGEINQETKVSDLIKGTVTVWVDLGLKIENGVGYSNKMIGSGFFIDPNGYIITNHHVISNMVDPEYEGFSRLYISLADQPDERIPAKIIGWDKSLDLALLKTEVEPPYIFSLGSSEGLDVGDKIYAIGSPLGLDRTITSGIVSASDRQLLSTAAVMQIDAAINSGNSGGPTIDEHGAVQAVVFAGILDYQGLNFAIPVEYVKMILPRLYSGGELNHVWLGAYGRTKKNAMYQPEGVEVIYVKPGSAAAKAGMIAGDIIREIDDVPVSTIEEFQDILLSKIPNTISKVQCVSDSEIKNYSVYLSERPEYPGYDVYTTDLMQNYFLPIFGMQLMPTSEGKKNFIVTHVIQNSAADETGFSVNDKVEVSRTKLSEEKDSLATEVYAKKRRNGYVDIFISLYAALDSPNYF